MNHYHSITDPGHAHGYTWISDAAGSVDFGEDKNDGTKKEDTTDSAFTGITQTNDLATTYGAGNQMIYCGYGGSRDSPDGLNSLGPSSAFSDYGASHSHSHTLSVSTTLNNTTHTHSVTIDVRPPYYALAFIYKL
jgi:hypothetical protein